MLIGYIPDPEIFLVKTRADLLDSFYHVTTTDSSARILHQSTR